MTQTTQGAGPGAPPQAGVDPRVVLARIQAALAANQVDAAVRLAEEALAAGVETPLCLNLVAYRRQVEGRLDEAMALLDRAHRLAPRDVSILCALGGCLSQQGLDAQALVIYDQALELAPEHAPAHHGRGLALSALGQPEDSRCAHLRALDLAPDYPDVLGALADHAVRRGELDAAEGFARRGLALDRDEPACTLAFAFVAVRRDDDRTAAESLAARLARGGLSSLHLSALEALYAEALDRLDQPAAAFQAHARSNAAAAAVHAPLMARAGVEPAVTLCRRLLNEFAERERDWSGAPSMAADPEAPRAHVFLIGFVRSGTTLLEQVLASHPDVVALEEAPILRAIAPPWFKAPASLDRLTALDAAEADRLRADYWRRVRDAGTEPAGRVFVDKNPLDAPWLPMVAKLFPHAKVLIARRDPRDVVVSSLRHRFIFNVLTSAFTDLASAADFYDALMALTERYRADLPLPMHAHRHEDLVADFDGVVQDICRFVGLDWNEAMRDFAETARRRDIRTPSADQVRRGLSDEGLGRWRRYGPAVDPVLPTLQPWLDRFGYAP